MPQIQLLARPLLLEKVAFKKHVAMPIVVIFSSFINTGACFPDILTAFRIDLKLLTTLANITTIPRPTSSMSLQKQV